VVAGERLPQAVQSMLRRSPRHRSVV